MTAEIALLNKVAVALAADSAATIATGNKNEKVFNSEDKLFELSNVQPIGIMIYNAPHFLETPIQIIIKKYRALNRHFATIDQAADDFKRYLKDFADSLDVQIQNRSFARLAREPTHLVSDRFASELRRLQTGKAQINSRAIFRECVDYYFDLFQKSGKCHLGKRAIKEIERMSKELKQDIDNKKQSDSGKVEEKRLHDLIELFLKSGYPSGSSMGVVIAGFAENELFPSLRSFVVDGFLAGSIRLLEPKKVDILFGGPSAKVLPYAQQDMVDRFVCGIDRKSQKKIESFCKSAVNDFNTELLDVLDLDDEDSRKELRQRLDKARDVFVDRLKSEGFGKLKDDASKEVENMIEFMPKPDMAQMAESLVELTSIKRRVSKGFDTVGGPIDVAVISKSEGFVWIKRKHYFDLHHNARYIARLENRMAAAKGVSDGTKRKSGRSGAGEGNAASRRKGTEGSAIKARVVPNEESVPRGVPGEGAEGKAK